MWLFSNMHRLVLKNLQISVNAYISLSGKINHVIPLAEVHIFVYLCVYVCIVALTKNYEIQNFLHFDFDQRKYYCSLSIRANSLPIKAEKFCSPVLDRYTYFTFWGETNFMTFPNLVYFLILFICITPNLFSNLYLISHNF